MKFAVHCSQYFSIKYLLHQWSDNHSASAEGEFIRRHLCYKHWILKIAPVYTAEPIVAVLTFRKSGWLFSFKSHKITASVTKTCQLQEEKAETYFILFTLNNFFGIATSFASFFKGNLVRLEQVLWYLVPAGITVSQ